MNPEKKFKLLAPTGEVIESYSFSAALLLAGSQMEEDRLRLMVPGDRYAVVDSDGWTFTWERIA